MNNYLIKVEPLTEEGKENLSEEYLDGVECEGFAMIGDKGGKALVSVQNMDIVQLAQCIFRSDTIMAAAHIAKAMKEGEMMAKKQDMISDILSSLGDN